MFLFLAALTAIAVLGGCGALDSILPSTGTYKINAKINDTPLENFSIVSSKDKIEPFFEEPVSEDPDITELVIFLKDSRGLTTGYKITYSLAYNDKNDNNEDEPELQIEHDNSKTDNSKTDTSKTDASKTDASKTDTSKTDNSKTDTSKTDISITDTSKTDTSKTDTSKTDTSKTDASKTDTSKTDTSKTDTSKTDTSKTDTSKTDASKTDTSKTDTSKTDTSKTDTSKTDTSKTDASKTGSSATDSSKTDNSKDASTAGTGKNDEERKDAVAENTDIFEDIEYIKKGNEIIFPVKSLDEALPFFPLPPDLPIGKYTLVFQVMGKNTILYKYEKFLFYLADAQLSFEGIQVHLPGIAENSQFIQNRNVILLDIKLDFDSRLNPYVVWYNGKRIIDEGRFSDGAGTLLWKAPEQNGFVSLRAEVFPSWERTGLAGYQKGISLLVSSKEIDMHLLSKDAPNLVQWYTFEGDLNELLTKGSENLIIEPAGKNKLNWMPSNGTYGLASGDDNAYKLPYIPISNDEDENWQIISRFKPLSEGGIFSVQFGPAFDVTMTLSNIKSNLILTLASAAKTSSEVIKLPDEDDSFVTVSVKFFIRSGQLYAKMALEKPALENSALEKSAFDFENQSNPVINPISLEADLDKEFKITLGQQKKNPADNALQAAAQLAAAQSSSSQKQVFTALWDEFAAVRLPAVEIIMIKQDTVKQDTKETPAEETTAAAETEPPETTDTSGFDDDSTLPE